MTTEVVFETSRSEIVMHKKQYNIQLSESELADVTRSLCL